MDPTWDRDQERSRLVHEYHARRTRERAEASARLLAPLAALAAIIAPEVVVHLGGGHVMRAGSFSRRRAAGGDWIPEIIIYQSRLGQGDVRSAAELDSILLHELGHYLLDHQGRYRSVAEHAKENDEAEALGAALAEHYAPELNAPLADVLDHF